VIVIAKGGVESTERWFRPAEELVVLSIMSSPATGSKLLLWSDSQSAVAFFPASDFVIVDAALSPLWSAKIDLNGYVELSPGEWQYDGFWERYHAEEPGAVSVFERTKTAMQCRQPLERVYSHER
jgi:hypothetical protein